MRKFKNMLIQNEDEAPFRSFQLPRQKKLIPKILIISMLGDVARDVQGVSCQNSAEEFEGIATVQLINAFSLRGFEVSETHWLKLATQIHAVLEKASVNGIVIIHEPDGIEETGFFLSQTISTMVPVVLATPSNVGGLRDAVRVAASPDACAYGVTICADGAIYSPKTILRSRFCAGRSFEAADCGTLGAVDRLGTRFHNASMSPFQQPLDISNVNKLPKVEIIPAHAGATDEYIRHCIGKGVQGLVLAGVGNGTANEEVITALSSAVKLGVLVIRSTRLSNAMHIGRNYHVNDDHYGFVASGMLDAPRSKILAQLLLANSVKDPVKVQVAFDQRGRQ